MARSSSSKRAKNAAIEDTTRAQSSGGKSLTGPSRRIRATTAYLHGEEAEKFFPSSSEQDESSEEWDYPGETETHFADNTQTVPKSLVKFIIALFLLSPAWVLTETFFQTFSTSVQHGLLATQTFGCFAAGMILFGIFCLVIPRQALMIAYVLGHEVTHAIWIWIFGGKVANQFHVSHEGGHVETDRVNTWIILAPYFFPIYSILVVTIYGALALAAHLIGNYKLIQSIDTLHWLLFLLVGFTLAFHLVFTCLIITKGQPDLHYGGTFFSLMVIYLINLLVITGLLLITSRQVSLSTYAHLLVSNSINFLEYCCAVSAWIVASGRDFIGDLQNQ